MHDVTTDQTVAQTILQQLGGRRVLKIMTGAHGFLAMPDRLIFALPGDFAKDGITRITIRLDLNTDTYEVTYEKPAAEPLMLQTVSVDSDVYAGNLVRCLELTTGLCLTLPRFA